MFGSSSRASSGSAFGNSFGTSGSGGAQQQPRVGSRVTPYAVTNDMDSGVGAQAGKFLCISAMPAYKDKQLEELRWEDYATGNKGGPNSASAQPAAGGIFGQQQQPAPAAASPFGSGSTTFRAAATPNPFGSWSTPNPFRVKRAFGSPSIPTPAFGHSTPAFGTSLFALSGLVGAFGRPTALAFGGASAPAFGQAISTPAFGSSPSPFGQSSGGAFGSSTFGTSAPSLFGQSSPGFRVAATPAFGGGASAPAFGGQTSSAFGGGGLFDNSQAANNGGGLFGASTPGSQSFASSPAPSFGSTLFGNKNTLGSLFGQTKPAGLTQSSVSFFSDGDDAPSTPKVDVMSSPSSAFDQYLASLPSYTYGHLDIERKEIRLIKLQAPIKSQPLCGNIIHVPLSAELHYWALSYCWGSLIGRKTIILDGKKLQITVNLDDALRQLGNSYGMLWVDAICINQEDIPEKSIEVLRMGEIYSRASGVAVWLGVGNKTSDKAMDFLQVLATKAPRSQYDEYLKELPLQNNLGKFGDEWIALSNLATNPYWLRTWIIQELVLCRRTIIVHCGTKSLPWDNFQNVYGPRNDDSIFFECIVLLASREDSIGHLNLQMLCSSHRHLECFDRYYVCDLSCSTSSFLATDPRDKVYGMLALNANLRELVPHPNYANSVSVVFRDLTKAMLATGYKLDLICLKLPTHINQSNDISWVPNWDECGPWLEYPNFLFEALGEDLSRSAYSADAGKDADITFIGDDSILRVRGFSYDRVDGLGPILDWLPNANYTSSKRQGVVEPDHEQNAYGSDVDTFRALKQLSQEMFRRPNSQATQLGYSLNNKCLIPRLSRQIAFMDHNSTDTQLILQWLQQTEEFSFVGRSLQEWYEMACTHGQALPSSVVQMDPELDGMLKCTNKVASGGWRWLSTNRGYLGRTHPQTQKGDEIVIVQGCTVPMVLRPCGQYYSVVGAAYVQGIMNGEALQGVSDDQMRYFDLA